MLVIRAVAFKGRPIDREISGRFGETGGTIGRGETSTLVLPDPERYISRTHAAVSFQAGGYVITDSGSKNPIQLNGRALGAGSQAKLSNGDRLQIGDYVLEVALSTPTPRQVGDPFAGLPPPPTVGRPQRPAPDPWPGTPQPASSEPRHDALGDLRGPEPSIEELFGLKDRPAPPLDAPDPLPPPGPGGRPSWDIDQLLGGRPRPASAPSVPDHGPEISTPYVPPAARRDPVFDPVVDAPVAMPQVSAPRSPDVEGEPAVTPTAAPPPAAARTTGSGDDASLQAFLRGAGLTSARLTELTPETLGAIGALLREAVQGTLDLLRARGLTKSELRADVTMVMGTDNNPLKFSPSVEAALTHLLAPPMPGFMPPLRAMKESYDDLRSHQLGFLAGMRAALEDMLERFSPQALESGLPPAGALDGVMPNRRKAQLWELFVDRHAEVVEAARDDFNATFGKAFVRAYQAQVKRLRAEGSTTPGAKPAPGR